MFNELLSKSGLSLDRLESFCLVAEAGGVTKAAKGDPARQSLFSRQIKELEEFFGTELIRRKGRGVVLTEAGERLNVIARESFGSLADFQSECKSRPIEVVIGTGESVIQWLLMPRLEKLRQQIPNVRLKFLNLPTYEAVARLADGLIDFALVRSGAVSRPLVVSPIGSLSYSLFLPPSSEARQDRKSVATLLNTLPLATLEGEGSFRSELAELGKQHGIKFNIQIECPSFPLAARAVVLGGVAAILPTIAQDDLREAGVRQVQIPFLKSLEREMCLASNARLIRIRPILERVAAVLMRMCRF